MTGATKNAESTKSEERICELGHAAAAAADGILDETRESPPSAEEEAAFLSALADGEWHNSGKISTRYGLHPRVQRKCAQFSNGAVISSSKTGYRLTRSATLPEMNRFEARMQSQIRKMLQRIVDTRKARNAGEPTS